MHVARTSSQLINIMVGLLFDTDHERNSNAYTRP